MVGKSTATIVMKIPVFKVNDATRAVLDNPLATRSTELARRVADHRDLGEDMGALVRKRETLSDEIEFLVTHPRNQDLVTELGKADEPATGGFTLTLNGRTIAVRPKLDIPDKQQELVIAALKEAGVPQDAYSAPTKPRIEAVLRDPQNARLLADLLAAERVVDTVSTRITKAGAQESESGSAQG